MKFYSYAISKIAFNLHELSAKPVEIGNIVVIYENDAQYAVSLLEYEKDITTTVKRLWFSDQAVGSYFKRLSFLNKDIWKLII